MPKPKPPNPQPSAGAQQPSTAPQPQPADAALAAGAGGTGNCFPCEVSGVIFALPNVSPPDVFVTDRITGAGVLMLAYQYGTRLRFLDVPTRAVELLDTDRVCVGDPVLLDRLYCWTERDERLDARQRAHLAARVLGIPHPDVDDAKRDTRIQPMLARLLDAVNAICDPGPLRTAAPPGDVENLEAAVLAVRARLSQSMTGLVTLQVRDLQRQLENAIAITDGLADSLQLPCGFSNSPDRWGALEVLVGDQLRADGVDIIEGAQTAAAWSDVFAFLGGGSYGYVAGSGNLPTSGDVCRAAALLRPRQPRCELELTR